MTKNQIELALPIGMAIELMLRKRFLVAEDFFGVILILFPLKTIV